MIPLYQSFLDSSPNIGSDNQVNDLYTQIDQIRYQPSTTNTNELCWRSEKKFNNIDWLLKEITNKVFKAISYYSNKDSVFSNAFENINKEQLKIHYWTNINLPGSRNVMHSHKSAIFSGVYYVQGTDTGSLRIINPANILGECNNLSPFTRDFYYEPKDRDLILWPSWLPHEVETNTSKRERINIAYDVIL